jgi:hypothetical protein
VCIISSLSPFATNVGWIIPASRFSVDFARLSFAPEKKTPRKFSSEGTSAAARVKTLSVERCSLGPPRGASAGEDDPPNEPWPQQGHLLRDIAAKRVAQKIELLEIQRAYERDRVASRVGHVVRNASG